MTEREIIVLEADREEVVNDTETNTEFYNKLLRDGKLTREDIETFQRLESEELAPQTSVLSSKLNFVSKYFVPCVQNLQNFSVVTETTTNIINKKILEQKKSEIKKQKFMESIESEKNKSMSIRPEKIIEIYWTDSTCGKNFFLSAPHDVQNITGIYPKFQFYLPQHEVNLGDGSCTNLDDIKVDDYIDCAMQNIKVDNAMVPMNYVSSYYSFGPAPVIKSFNSDDIKDPVIELIYKASRRNLNHTMHSTIITDLYGSGLLDLYLTANSGDSKKSQRELAMFEQKYFNRNKIKEFHKQNSEHKLNEYKKKYLTMRKYGTQDYEGLSHAQKVVIDKMTLDEEPPRQQALLNAAIERNDIGEIKKLLETPSDACEHVITLANMIVNTKGNLITKNEKIRKEIMEKYSEGSRLGARVIYCKLCGEALAQNEEDLENMFNEKNYSIYTEDSSDDFREIIIIISKYFIIKRPQAVNMRNIVIAISNLLTKILENKQSELNKMRLLSSEHTTIILGIYKYLYIFAIMIQIIFYNEDLFDIVDEKIVGGQGPYYAEGGEAEEITYTKIENKVSDKKRLQNLLGSALSIIKKVKYIELLNNPLVTDNNVKEYLVEAYRWAINLNIIIGKYSKPVDMKYIHSLDKVFMIVRAHAEKKIITEPEENYDNRGEKTTKLLSDYVNDKIFLERVYPPSDKLQLFLQKFSTSLEDQETRQLDYKLKKFKPDFIMCPKPIKYPASSDYIDRVKDRSLCVCGMKQVRDLIFDVDGKENKISTTDFSKLFATDTNFLAKLYDSRLVRVECQSCINVADESEDKILFYARYEVICPVDEFHQFELTKNIETCTKCGITRTIINSKDNNYYQKYKNKYAEYEKFQYQEIEDHIKSIQFNPFIQKPKYVAPEKVEISNENILKLCKMIEISHIILLNLGLSEGYNYSKIKHGKENPYLQVTAERASLRNLMLEKYYYMITQHYYLLKFSSLQIAPPPQIEHILTSISNKNFHNILPDLPPNDVLWKGMEDPRKYSLVLLDLIARTILFIIDAMPQRENGIKFVKFLIDKLMQEEDMRSEHELVVNEENDWIEDYDQTMTLKGDISNPDQIVENAFSVAHLDMEDPEDEDNLVDIQA